LELAGRDVYVSEGCYNCHSQMVRTLVPEVMRYGRPGVADDYSHLGESLFDHPYQWGSKRTGPDLAREGGPIAEGSTYMRLGKRGNDWHFNHFINPRVTEGSNMPSYHWLVDKKTNIKALPNKIRKQVVIGVPWPVMTDDEIMDRAKVQAREIAENLVKAGVYIPGRDELQGDALRSHLEQSEMVALISYMQKLGSYREVKPATPKGPSSLDPDSHREASNR
jgi:cytochrome c oxidase cbb3-type subunit I/II